jgi:hypothetical protein
VRNGMERNEVYDIPRIRSSAKVRRHVLGEGACTRWFG